MSTEARSEWPYLRTAFLAVAAILTVAVAGWRVHDALHDEPTAFELLRRCMINEKHVALTGTSDPIARSAELGAVRTAIETNGVTISVSSSPEGAARIVAAYGSVAGNLGTRLEQRGGTVYLWDGPPSPSQRQTLYDCTY